MNAIPKLLFRSVILLTFILCTLAGCKKDAPTELATTTTPAGDVVVTAEELLINAVDEIVALADVSAFGKPPGGGSAVAKTEADSVYVYGQITPDGFGAVVTERHAYPKGLLLITVRKSFGRNGRIVSDSRRYISQSDLQLDLPQQSTLTEVIPLSQDTILTRVVRNGLTETYTFRLPVVTRNTNQSTGTTTVTSRFAQAGAVISEVRDGVGTFVRRTISTALPSGGLQTRTEYADGSWRNVTVLGQADGSVLRDILSGTQ